MLRLFRAEEYDESMENRRQDFRHIFLPARRPRVELQLAHLGTTFKCQVIDLSVGGMRIRCDKDQCLPRETKDQVVARITQVSPAGAGFRLELLSALVHSEPHENARDYGLRFLPATRPSAAESRDKAIWRFLIGEQRRRLV